MVKYRLFTKRIFDILGSVFLLVFLSPLLIIIFIGIRFTSNGNATFLQNRVGRYGTVFKVYKFRTMLIPEDRIQKDGTVLEPNRSITKFGKFLRKYSLDELLQLVNVLKGDMSFVGPRPMLPSQVEKITIDENIRHQVRPGITGLAQVSGRNSLSWDEKLKLDKKYVESHTLSLDFCILLKTVKVVFAHEGIEYVHEMGDKKR